MNTAQRKYVFGTVMILALLCSSCSTRGIHNKYNGATEQRLITRSVDALVKKLPEKDFMPLKEKTVYLACHFIEDSAALKYAKTRIELELLEKYKVTLVTTPDLADKVIHIFFNAIGTDQDNIGFQTPEFIIPGLNGSMEINLLSLNMFHGVSELYYYILDQDSAKIMRGAKIKSRIRTDRLALPIISIPINTLD